MSNQDTYLFALSSKNGQGGFGVNGGEITYQLNSPNVNCIQGFRIKQVILEASWYNVTSIATDTINGQARNWYLSLDWIGSTTGPFVTNIPAGAYSNLELASQIAASVLAASGTTIVVSFLGPTQQMVITRTGGTDATLTVNPTSSLTNGWARLGFPASQGPSATLTGTQAYELNVTQTARVHFSTWGSLKSQSSTPATSIRPTGVYQSTVVASVPVAMVNSWQTSVFQIPSMEFTTIDETVTSLQFVLTDDQDRPLQLNRSGWAIDIEIWARKD